MGLNQIVIRSPLVAPTRIRIMEPVGAFVIIGSIGKPLQDSVLRVSATRSIFSRKKEINFFLFRCCLHKC